MTRSLFDTDDTPPLSARLAPALKSLAERGVYFGTSSWKYEGWLGSVYTRERYVTRGKFSLKKFESECLREYAETFPVVGGDFSFYQFPTADYWANLFRGLPSTFAFGLKVPEEITVKRWPGHARYGGRAGRPNEHFLDVAHFDRAFTQLLEPHRSHIALLMFEFGTFGSTEYPGVADFIEGLERFLQALPTGWRYAVEIRNKEYLVPDYFAVLARYNVAHVFNAWTRMPRIADQMTQDHAFTADFAVVRALLPKGRTYERAVEELAPYEKIHQPDLSTRGAMRQIVDRALRVGQRSYMFVNNRLEGNAPATIEAVIATESASDIGGQSVEAD